MAVAIIFIILIAILATICYLRVVYECIRKVRISKIANSSLKKTSSLSVSEYSDKNDVKLQIEEFKQAPGPLPWPILGNLAMLGRYAVPFQGFTEMAKQFGDVYSLTLGTTRCLIVNNLDLIREVLNQNGKYFGGRPDFLRFHKLFGGDRNNCE